MGAGRFEHGQQLGGGSGRFWPQGRWAVACGGRGRSWRGPAGVGGRMPARAGGEGGTAGRRAAAARRRPRSGQTSSACDRALAVGSLRLGETNFQAALAAFPPARQDAGSSARRRSAGRGGSPPQFLTVQAAQPGAARASRVPGTPGWLSSGPGWNSSAGHDRRGADGGEPNARSGAVRARAAWMPLRAFRRSLQLGLLLAVAVRRASCSAGHTGGR